MTRKDAYRIGLEMAREILTYGDYNSVELADEDAFREAFWEVVENRKQYAGEVTEDFRHDSEWEGYEEGLARGLDKHCAKHFRERM